MFRERRLPVFVRLAVGLSVAIPASLIVLGGYGPFAVPVAAPNTYNMNAGTTLVQPAPGVMNNDTPNGGVAVLVAPPTHATSFSLNNDGSFTYQPVATYAGVDLFKYKVQNGEGSSSTVGATINVHPVLTSLTLTPVSVVGGFAGKLTVNLNVPAPSTGTPVELSTNNATKVVLPPIVTVKSGTTAKSITFATKTVTAQTVASISAKFRSVTLTANLTLRTGGLLSMTVSPNPMAFMGTSVGTVTLSASAPPAGRTIELVSASSEISYPVNVVIPGGATSTVFDVEALVGPFSGSVVLTAKLGTTTRSVTLTQNGPTSNIDMKMNAFMPAIVKVAPGTQLTWTNIDPMPHTVTPDVSGFGPNSVTAFPSGLVNGDVFQWTVPANAAIGTKYYYHCLFHGAPGDGSSLGLGMVGMIEVI